MKPLLPALCVLCALTACTSAQRVSAPAVSATAPSHSAISAKQRPTPTPTRKPIAKPTPKPAPTRTASVDTGIEVYADCVKPTVEPTELVLACADQKSVLQELHWTTWNRTEATATGTLVYSDCSPDCASGHNHRIAGVRVTLTAPVRGAAGSLVFSREQNSPEIPGYQNGPYAGGPLPLTTRPD